MRSKSRNPPSPSSAGYALPAALVVLLVVAATYSISGNWPLLRLINKILATSGTVLIALSFLLGPVYKWFKPDYNPLEYRKFFGMVGFGLVALHALFALSFGSVGSFRPENLLPVLVGALSFILFSVLAATSSSLVIEGLGYETWRRIQQTGYVALVFVLLHVAFIGEGKYLSSWIGQVVFILVLATLLARVYLLMKR